MTDTAPLRPRGADIIAAIKAAGVEFVVALPDIVTSDGLLWPISRDEDLRLVRVCKEDEGVSICAGLAFAGRRSVLMMQQTGLMDSLNVIRAVGVDYRQPICMIVGLQGKEPDRLPADSQSYGVRIIEPILDVMAIARHRIEGPDDVAIVESAIREAYETSSAVVMLIGRSPV